jgi:methionine synthase II (cobalamin-independent)
MPNLLTTTVIGSYTVPDWYPALQEAVTAGKLAPEVFRDAKAVAARAAIKDQEVVLATCGIRPPDLAFENT